MGGKIDEFSLRLGEHGASIDNLADQFAQHELLDDGRHKENLSAIREQSAAVRDLTKTLAPIAETVARIAPIVDGYQITKWKLGGAFGLAVILITFFGWLVSMFAGRLIKLVLLKVGGV